MQVKEVLDKRREEVIAVVEVAWWEKSQRKQ